jgi:hypothetical protein
VMKRGQIPDAVQMCSANLENREAVLVMIEMVRNQGVEVGVFDPGQHIKMVQWFSLKDLAEKIKAERDVG